MIRIIIVEDNEVVRNVLALLIAGESDMEVVGTAANGPMALALLDTLSSVDIVISDYSMPGMDGVELTSKINLIDHRIKVIILTMHRQITYRDKALAAGAKGYLLKEKDEQEIFTGIRVVYAGDRFIGSGFPV